MSLTKRSNKGSALTYIEVDDNFTHLGGDGTYQFPGTDGSADQVLATDGSGQLSFVDVSMPKPEISRVNWTTGGEPIYTSPTSTAQSVLQTSYTSYNSSIMVGRTKPTVGNVDKARSIKMNGQFDVSKSSGALTQTIYQRVQLKAPGSATSAINLGTATNRGVFGSGYSAMARMSIPGDKTYLFTGGNHFTVGGDIATNSSGSANNRNIYAVTYDDDNDYTMIYTAAYPAHPIAGGTNASTTLYYDPFEFVSAMSMVTIAESKQSTYLNSYGHQLNIDTFVNLPYGSYALEYDIRWRKSSASGSANMQDFILEYTALPIEET